MYSCHFPLRLDSVFLELKIEGSNIPLVEEIKKRTNDLSSNDMQMASVQEGSIIVGLKVSASAFHTVEKFIGKIDTLLSNLLQMYQHYGNGHTSSIVASLNFMDEQNGKFMLSNHSPPFPLSLFPSEFLYNGIRY